MTVKEFLRKFYGLNSLDFKNFEITANVSGELKRLYYGSLTDERLINSDILNANIRRWGIIAKPSKRIWISVENP